MVDINLSNAEELFAELFQLYNDLPLHGSIQLDTCEVELNCAFLDRDGIVMVGYDKITTYHETHSTETEYIEDMFADLDEAIQQKVIECFDDSVRRCSVCGKLMREGYCVDMGDAYYCSDECLHTKYTDEEWEEECRNNDQSYYTEW